MISNAGPNEPIDKISSKGKGRPKGKPKKNKGFKGTPKNLKMDIQNLPLIVTDNQINRNIRLGSENYSSVCFFNSVVQALFSSPSFRDHVKHFTTYRPSDTDAVSNVKTLFRTIMRMIT